MYITSLKYMLFLYIVIILQLLLYNARVGYPFKDVSYRETDLIQNIPRCRL